MTICIAAPCLQDDELRIVIVADRMMSNDDASGDIQFKYELLPSSLLALYSGPQSQALGLIYHYRLGLKKKAKVTVESLPKYLYRMLQKRQQELVDMAVGMNLGGITFNEFVAAGGPLDSGVGAEIMDEVNEARLKIELIVAGFLPDTMSGMINPIIIKVTEKGVNTFKNFLCIGVGTVPAEHALYRREQSELLRLDQTIYNLFEAKKMAEIAPGSGRQLPWLL
jgi:hypothetical protein